LLSKPHAEAAGVRKAPKHEIAVGRAPGGAAVAMGIWARGRGAGQRIFVIGRPAGENREDRLKLMERKNQGPVA